MICTRRSGITVRRTVMPLPKQTLADHSGSQGRYQRDYATEALDNARLTVLRTASARGASPATGR